MDERPIGVFDSGVGGLTVLHECLVTLPHEDFLYLGDGARLPYGPRPLDELRRFAREIGSFLEARGVKLVVVACNSATAAALPELQTELRVPVVGVIAPEAHAAVQATRNRRIGLLATQATVSSGRYEELVRALDAGASVLSVACPRLVPLIEGDDPFAEETAAAVRGVRGAAEGGRHRHRHPRLHPLPADPADPAAGLRPRRHARLLGGRDRSRGRRDAAAEGDRERPGARGRLQLPHHRRHGRLPRDGPALPAAPDRRGRARRDRSARGGGCMSSLTSLRRRSSRSPAPPGGSERRPGA